MACSHHDQANGCEERHEGESLRATPSVQSLRQRDITRGCDAVGHNVNSIKQGVRLPITGEIGNQVAQDRALECIHEV